MTVAVMEPHESMALANMFHIRMLLKTINPMKVTLNPWVIYQIISQFIKRERRGREWKGERGGEGRGEKRRDQGREREEARSKKRKKKTFQSKQRKDGRGSRRMGKHLQSP